MTDANTVPELLNRCAGDHAGRIAIVAEDGVLSYAEFADEASRWENVLVESGLARGDRLALVLGRSATALAVSWACWRRGVVLVPVDPAYPDERIRLLLADCSPSAVVCGPHEVTRLRALTSGRGCILEEAGESGAQTPPRPDVAAADPAYVLYTSGSTGRPKGVVVSHRAFGHYVRYAGRRYAGASGLSPWHGTLCFDATFTSIWVPLTCGGQVRVIAEATPMSGIEGVADLLRGRKPVGLLKATPTFLDALDRWLEDERCTARIRTLVVGGEQLSPAQVRPWLGRADEVVNEYGPTEAAVGVTVASIGEADLSRTPLPVGRPLPGTVIHLLDDDSRPVDGAGVGELGIEGPQLADGYLGQPELSAGRFVRLDAASARRVYRTGDLARRDEDGNLYVLGRIDEQFKHRGYRIEPREIEDALCAETGVRRAAVVRREERLVGFVVGDELDPGRLCRRIAEVLPHHLVPDEVVVFEALPITDRGKVDRAALAGLVPGGTGPSL